MQITCGRCTKESGDIVKHTSVEFIRECYANEFSLYEEMLQDQGRAEYEAEMAAERYWELGIDDGFDEWEASRGVLSYEDARDAAARSAT
jgi:hypothetical protein